MTKEELQKAGDEFVLAIQKEMVEKNLNATGEGSASLSALATPNKIVISAVARLLFLEYGRAPGKPPPVKVIIDWVERKLNIPIDQVEPAAWAIVNHIRKKIAEEGTAIFSDRAKGLELEIILADLYDKLSEKVFNFEATVMVDQITDAFNGTK